MYCYVAFIWKETEPITAKKAHELIRRFEAQSDDWRCVIRTSGFVIFLKQTVTGNPQVYILHGGAGAVIGTLFSERNDIRHISHSAFNDPAEAQALAASAGTHLLERYWGSYVAFLCDRESGKYHILRDPSGRLSCYHFSADGVDVIFSDIEQCPALQNSMISINWTYLAAFLLSNTVRARETGIKGITRIGPGECLTVLNQRREFHLYWNPERFYRAREAADFEAAAALLKHTAQGCISAWASCHRDIVLELSGGFDSSAVLACLQQLPDRPRVTCLNYHAGRADSDERTFARLSARQALLQLIEHELCSNHAEFSEVLAEVPLAPEPTRHLLDRIQSSFRAHLVETLGVDMFWTGQGGDQLLLRTRSPLTAADYVWDNGLNGRAWKIASDTSRLTRVPLISVFSRTIVNGLFRIAEEQEENTVSAFSILNEDIRLGAPKSYFRYPWEGTWRSLPPGKVEQILTLFDLLNHRDLANAYGRAGIFHPLLSQPLMELCLSLPVYLLTYGGRHRALARQAFADDIPSKILTRETKGATSHYFYRIFTENRRFLRGYLLDGILMREGLLDRAGTEKFFVPDRLLRVPEMSPLLGCIAAEAWLRKLEAILPVRASG